MKWKEKKLMNREGLARLLQDLSEGIAKRGSVEYAGHQTILPEEIEVEVECKEKHGKSKLEIEVKWRSRAARYTATPVASSEAIYPVVKIASREDLPPWKAIPFTYPSVEDEAVLITLPSGELRAYSTVCPHRGKHVTWDMKSHKLYCPAHKAFFNPEDGEKIGGPGGERLTKIRLKVKGNEVFATGLG